MGGSCVFDRILSRVGAEGALNVLSPPSARFASAGFHAIQLGAARICVGTFRVRSELRCGSSSGSQ